jgi:uncharacterized protein YjbI with pentapeptide repeats
MSAQVEAAIIASSVGVLTLIGTLVVQFYGIRRTSRDTEKTLGEQGKQLDRTLAEQREQLDRTLAEQREQLDRTLAEQRTRTLNERFATAADQLGSDKPPIRLAGVYAMAGLADDWEENRQICVDVLCAYLRMPYEPDPGQDTPKPQRLAFQAIREVRHTVIRVITAHLRKDMDVAKSWQGLNFDFRGVVFDGGDFTEAHFSGGTVFFSDAQFSRDAVHFSRAQFSGGKIYFSRAQFSDGMLDFTGAQFSGSEIYFNAAQFSGRMVSFIKAQFSGRFSGSEIYFVGTQFSGGLNYFSEAHFSGGEVDFGLAQFSGGEVSFGGAQFSGGTVSFGGAQFSGSRVDFTRTLSDDTGDLIETQFSGGEVDFSDVGDWSFPPKFPWTDTPPSGVKLPRKEDQSQV